MSTETNSDSSKSHLLLEISTHSEEIDYITRRVAEHWGKDASFEGFARWSQLAFESPVARQQDNGIGMYCFILKDLNIKNNSIEIEEKDQSSEVSKKKLDQIVSRCETLNRPIFKVSGSTLKEVVAVNFSLVLTFPEFRKRGYGESLVEEVYHFWKGTFESTINGSENIAILFSAVGEYYSRVGFKSNAVKLHFIFPENDKAFTKDGDISVSYLQFNTYGSLIESFSTKLQEQLVIQSAAAPSKLLYALRPNIDIFNLIHEREFLQAMGKTEEDSSRFPANFKEVANVGAKLDKSNFIIWSHNIRNKRLDVLTVQYETVEKLNILLKAALDEVAKFDFIKLEIWDSSIQSEEHKEALKHTWKKAIWDAVNVVLPASRLFDESTGTDFEWVNVEPWTFC